MEIAHSHVTFTKEGNKYYGILIHIIMRLFLPICYSLKMSFSLPDGHGFLQQDILFVECLIPVWWHSIRCIIIPIVVDVMTLRARLRPFGEEVGLIRPF